MTAFGKVREVLIRRGGVTRIAAIVYTCTNFYSIVRRMSTCEEMALVDSGAFSSGTAMSEQENLEFHRGVDPLSV